MRKTILKFVTLTLIFSLLLLLVSCKKDDIPPKDDTDQVQPEDGNGEDEKEPKPPYIVENYKVTVVPAESKPKNLNSLFLYESADDIKYSTVKYSNAFDGKIIEALQKYDDGYFKNNILTLFICEFSNSNIDIEKLNKENGILSITFKDTNDSNERTPKYIILELNRNLYSDITTLNAKIKSEQNQVFYKPISLKEDTDFDDSPIIDTEGNGYTDVTPDLKNKELQTGEFTTVKANSKSNQNEVLQYIQSAEELKNITEKLDTPPTELNSLLKKYDKTYFDTSRLIFISLNLKYDNADYILESAEYDYGRIYIDIRENEPIRKLSDIETTEDVTEQVPNTVYLILELKGTESDYSLSVNLNFINNRETTVIRHLK